MVFMSITNKNPFCLIVGEYDFLLACRGCDSTTSVSKTVGSVDHNFITVMTVGLYSDLNTSLWHGDAQIYLAAY